MPIAPVFPDSGSGGEGDSSWLPLNIGGWTEADSAGLVDTILGSGGIYEVTENTVSASADLVYSSTTYTAYRAYTPLLDANGDPVLCDKQSSIEIQVKRLAPTGVAADACVALGVAVDPSSTVYTSILASGVGFHQNALSVINGYVHDGTGSNFLTGSSIVGAFGSISLGANTQNVTWGAAYNASKARVGSPASRNYNGTIGAATPLYLWLEYSKRTNADAGVAGAQLKFQAQYRISTPTALL